MPQETETSTAPAQPASCPRCAAPLRAADVQPHGLLGCVSCGGVFLSHSGVRATLSEGHAALETLAARVASLAQQTRATRADQAFCPVCAEAMTPVDIRGRGFTAYSCDAHGSWFDAGDVARLRGPAVGAAYPAPAAHSPFDLSAPRGAHVDEPVAGLVAFSTASRLSRLGAQVLDGLFLLPAFVLAWFLGATDAPFLVVFVFGFGAILGCACAQMYWAATRGQTFGKKKAGIRVVRVDGSPAGAFRILILRNFVPYYVIPWAVSAAWETLGAVSESVPGALLVPAAMALSPVFFLFSQFGILLIFLPPRRAIHDYCAGTIVVPA